MIADVQSLFSDRQAITVSAPSTNVYDRGKLGVPVGSNAPKRDIGRGTKIPLLCQVTEEFVGGTSVEIAVQVDDNVGFSSPRTVAKTGAIPVADLDAGYQFSLDTLPRGLTERYVRLYYTVVGGPTAGKIFAGVVLAVDELADR